MKQLNKNRGVQIYSVALVLTIIANFFAQTVLVEQIPSLIVVFKGVRVFAAILLCGKLLLERVYLRKTFVWELLLGVYVSIVAIITDNYLAVIPVYLLIYAAYNINFIYSMRVSLYSLSSCMIITQVLVVLGVFYQVESIRDFGSIRYSLGYTFVSFASNYLLHALCLYIVVRGKSLRWIEIIGWGGLNLYVYHQTDTKSSFILAVFLLIVVSLVKKIEAWHRSAYFRMLEQWMLPVGIAIALCTTELYRWNSSLLEPLNQLLTGRLALGVEGLEKYGYSLFGQPVEWVFFGETQAYLYVDSSFLNIAINYGLILLIVLSIAFYKVVNCVKLQTTMYSVALIFTILHSIYDPQFLEIVYNPLLLVLSRLFMKYPQKNT